MFYYSGLLLLRSCALHNFLCHAAHWDEVEQPLSQIQDFSGEAILTLEINKIYS